MGLKGFCALLMMGLWLSACATLPKVFVDQDPDQSFASYRTFAWAKNPPMSVSGDYKISPLMEKRMTNGIKKGLLKKGYQYTDDLHAADFAVSFTLGARDRVHVDAYPAPFYSSYDSWGWGRTYYPGAAYKDPFASERRQYSSYTTKEGSLAIDAFDVASRQPVWHGASSKTIDDADIEGLKQDAYVITKSILDKFPTLGGAPQKSAQPQEDK